jgi:hypothetical protein
MKVSESGYCRHLRRPDKADPHQALLAMACEVLREDPENANYGVKRIGVL